MEAIKIQEIGAVIAFTGRQFIDYADREALTLNFPICDECRRKLLGIDKGGLEAAKRRAREMRDGDGRFHESV